MIPYIDIDLSSPVTFYDEFDLIQEEVDMLLDLIEKDKVQEAIDYFINEHILPPGIKYQEVLSKYLLYSSSGPIKSEDRDKLTRNITLLTLGLTSLLYANYNTFTKKVYSDYVFKTAGLIDSKSRKAVRDQILNEFDQTIHGTFTQTQYFITNSIKNLQTEIFTINAYLNKAGIEGNALNLAIDEFKTGLKKRYPEIFKAIREGNVLITHKYGLEGYRVKHFKVDNYIDGIIRNNLLNLDRTSNIVAATIANEKVLEFYKADSRPVKDPREICQSILANKVSGVSILALDDETAEKLGVMTVQEAESTPDFSFGYNCTHGLRRLNRAYLSQINKILEE